LFVRFAVISVLAFGGGQAALPLVERLVVSEAHWLSASAFGTAVAFGYLTPGPVLITATFVGHRVAGLPGAVAATLGVFFMPWLLSTLAARKPSLGLSAPTPTIFRSGRDAAVIGPRCDGAGADTRGRRRAPGFPMARALLLLPARVHPAALLAGADRWLAR
jgi:chromate transporter